jgi:hypothetical protein
MAAILDSKTLEKIKLNDLESVQNIKAIRSCLSIEPEALSDGDVVTQYGVIVLLLQLSMDGKMIVLNGLGGKSTPFTDNVQNFLRHVNSRTILEIPMHTLLVVKQDLLEHVIEMYGSKVLKCMLSDTPCTHKKH